jgi:hypothetical protein
VNSKLLELHYGQNVIKPNEGQEFGDRPQIKLYPAKKEIKLGLTPFISPGLILSS